MAQKKKKSSNQKAIVNRRARYDYELGEDLVAGLELTGLETRAARDGHVQLKGAYAAIDRDELWLHNVNFSLNLNEKGKDARTIDTRSRKLLVHKKQIEQLKAAKATGQTIVPIKMLTGGRFIKIIIAMGKGKRKYDKRQTIKRRDIERDQMR